MTRVRAIFVAVVFVAATRSEGARIVVAGTGNAGNWTTEFIVSNPTPSPLAVSFTFFLVSPFDTGCNLPDCPALIVTLPPNGTTTVGFDDFPPELRLASPLQTTYISTSPDVLPAVRARTINRISKETVDLPAISFCSAPADASGDVVFPGVAESEHIHSNIVIAQQTDMTVITPDLVIQVTAYDSGGAAVGAGTFALAQGDTLFILDVLRQLGIQSLDNGSLHVKKVAGHGMMWGANAIVEDGKLPILVPGNPF